MLKFSLILPVYNVEKYLPKCIDSCLNQDLPKDEYEIIIVIDGSPDGSLNVARRYEQKFECIRIVEQVNEGLSAARNTGLANAKGKYVWFIDSDDIVCSNVLKGVFDTIEQSNLDALWIRWNNVDTQYNIMPPYDMNIHEISEKVFSGIDFMKHVLGIYLYAWSFIYKRDFLVSNDLLFKKGMYYEDTEFAFKALPSVNRIRLYNHVCYDYVNRAGSIVNTINEKKLSDICLNMVQAYRLYIASKDKLLGNFYKRCFSSFLLLAMKESAKSKNPVLKEKLHKLAKAENMEKLLPVGSKAMKAVGHIYNIFGFNVCMAVIEMLLMAKGKG